ncbi:PREDICTED: AAA-ATPase At3g50940-like [Ipomoea nil]|uniref:AAA-ATPase At3g50940-like n=1 Tax=Ipomoea nil TaxID=35883 RepID=UPI0009010F47|nr:PREDICTED: AAA-ATPase At3g50940-like [Ipomoea nil]
MFSLADMPSTTSVLSAYTAFTAFAVLMRTVISELQAMANQLVPGVIRDKVLSKLGGLFYCNFTSQVSLVIDEYNNNGRTLNEIFEASEVYLGTKLSPSADRLKISKAPEEKALSFIITKGDKITDTFQGMEFIWELTLSESSQGYPSSETVKLRSFELSFNKKFSEMVFKSYIPFVMERSKAIQEENKTIKLHSLGNWNVASVNLEHPSTFETLAIDGELKKEVIEDLERFVRRKDFYRRVGKAWKRGYLLYGPPGTGKSSLIAAMANYLKFDIYDLDLANLNSNMDLQSQLATTKNRSILVIEDIDCSIELQNRDLEHTHNQGDQSQLTLSGLLNFIDGLWSSCGDERIIVFTTNYKDRLDPALLRPGRMDMHIHMSYCNPSGFRVLASNYHGLKDHCNFIQIDKLLEEVEVTPAEIAEELMKSEDADVALQGLIKFMQKKKKKTAEGDEGKKVGRGIGFRSEEVKAVVEKKRVVKNKSKKRRNMVKPLLTWD